MGIEAAGGHYQNDGNPFQGAQVALNNWRERRAQFHQSALLQNQNHAFQAQESAAAHQRNLETISYQSDLTHRSIMQQMDKKYGQEKGLAVHSAKIAAIRADQDNTHSIARTRAQGSVDRSMERLKHKNAFGNRPSQFDALMEASNNPNVGNLSVGGASLSTRSSQNPANAGTAPKPKGSRKSAPPQA